MTEPCVIHVQYEAREELEREFRENLSLGRAFTRELHPVVPRQPARLVLSGPHAQCELEAEVVMVADQGPVQGVGLALSDFDELLLARVERFVQEAFGSSSHPPATGYPHANDGDQSDEEWDPTADGGDETEAEDPDEPEDAADRASSERPLRDTPATSRRPPPNARLRALRDMSMPEQIKLARRGEQADRVALERLLGKVVWDSLLRNPRITVAEVARIARKGTVPRPVLELIVDNAAWAKTGVVRRALLTNPKLSTDMVVRVLKFAPRNELKAMVRNPSYPNLVRTTAKRMIASG